MTARIEPTAKFDQRFSDPAASAMSWPDVWGILEDADLYWITTVRADGRPHVTPLVGAACDGAMHFCTGPEEQKARNLEQNQQVALITGNNDWAAGTDVVVEGTAVRVDDQGELQRIADAYEAKYGKVWRFEVIDGAFRHGAGTAHVFRIEPAKAIAFAKDPHGQTAFRFE